MLQVTGVLHETLHDISSPLFYTNQPDSSSLDDSAALAKTLDTSWLLHITDRSARFPRRAAIFR